jgi:hypothetical protein
MNVEFFYPPIISFKSSDLFYVKEIAGLKPNTVRELKAEDVATYCLCFEGGKLYAHGKEVTQIQIINARTCHGFIRTLTDVSHSNSRIIFSWKHEDVQKLDTFSIKLPLKCKVEARNSCNNCIPCPICGAHAGTSNPDCFHCQECEGVRT